MKSKFTLIIEKGPLNHTKILVLQYSKSTLITVATIACWQEYRLNLTTSGDVYETHHMEQHIFMHI